MRLQSRKSFSDSHQLGRLVVVLTVSGVDRLLAGRIGVIAARRPVVGRRVGRIGRGCGCCAYRSSCGGSAIRISRAAVDGGAVIGRGASVVRAAAIGSASGGGTATGTSSRPRPSAARGGTATGTSSRPRSAAARGAAATDCRCRPTTRTRRSQRRLPRHSQDQPISAYSSRSSFGFCGRGRRRFQLHLLRSFRWLKNEISVGWCDRKIPIGKCSDESRLARDRPVSDEQPLRQRLLFFVSQISSSRPGG